MAMGLLPVRLTRGGRGCPGGGASTDRCPRHRRRSNSCSASAGAVPRSKASECDLQVVHVSRCCTVGLAEFGLEIGVSVDGHRVEPSGVLGCPGRTRAISTVKGALRVLRDAECRRCRGCCVVQSPVSSSSRRRVASSRAPSSANSCVLSAISDERAHLRSAPGRSDPPCYACRYRANPDRSAPRLPYRRTSSDRDVVGTSARAA